MNNKEIVEKQLINFNENIDKFRVELTSLIREKKEKNNTTSFRKNNATSLSKKKFNSSTSIKILNEDNLEKDILQNTQNRLKLLKVSKRKSTDKMVNKTIDDFDFSNQRQSKISTNKICEKEVFMKWPDEYSFCIFHRENWFRLFCKDLFNYKHTDTVVFG